VAEDTTLSRWRHGFESRWGCKEEIAHEAEGSGTVVVLDEAVVTSETGTVVFLDRQAPSLSIRMDDDNEIRKLVGLRSAATA
jgi:hypothetical protein